MRTLNKPTAGLRWMLLCFVAMALGMASCYRFTLIEMPHEAQTNSTFQGKVVVKRSGSSNQGYVMQVYGLFAVCVPEGWTADGDFVMTQVPKATTDLGDAEYHKTIRRQLLPHEGYTQLLNDTHYKAGYTWLGFATESDFKSMFNTGDESLEVDSIYAEFAFKTNDKTGTFYLDYIAGQVATSDYASLGSKMDGWYTKTATFAADDIEFVTKADTEITVARPDGTIDPPVENPVIDNAWNLVLMDDATREGSPVKAYKDKLYDGLFTRTLGWNGGDGVFTVGLPDGNVFWTFNDSFYGRVGANRARGSNSFPRNSIMVQTTSDGFPGEKSNNQVWLADYVNWTQPSADRYYHCRTHLRHPLGEKTAAEIADGDIDQNFLYWSGDGRIYNGKLQLLWFGVDNRDGNMINIGTALATYNLDGAMPKNYYRYTLPDYLPKEGDYLYLESVDHNLNSNPISYGSTLVEGEDGHNYLYGTSAYHVLVARTETESLASKWEYYVCDDREKGDFHWQEEYPSDEQIANSNILKNNGQLNLPWVFKDGDWYYLVSQGAYFSRKVYLYRSKNPYGPFDEKRELFTLPATIDKIGNQNYHWLYMVNIHPALSRNGELVFTTNTDPDDFWDNFNAEGSADYYRPFFYRVFNWKLVYADNAETTAITRPVTSTASAADEATYDLTGRRTKATAKGVYISKRKKIIVK